MSMTGRFAPEAATQQLTTLHRERGRRDRSPQHPESLGSQLQGSGDARNDDRPADDPFS
jgi:hypothetical protein